MRDRVGNYYFFKSTISNAKKRQVHLKLHEFAAAKMRVAHRVFLPQSAASHSVPGGVDHVV
jgi:hypothetical protein